MTRDLLIICYYWPPAGGPGVQRWLKFATYLVKMDYNITMLVPENPDYPVIDASLIKEVPDEVNVIKAPLFEPSRLLSSLSRKRTKTLQKGIISKKPSAVESVMMWLRGNLFVPDARVGWVKNAVPAAQKFLNKHTDVTVITTGPPHSVHLIGAALKKSNQVQWLADFRDPWTTIGYHKDLRLGRRAHEKHLQLESQILKNADALTVTSEHTKAEFSQKTSVAITVVTNGFDMDPNLNNNQPEGAFTLSHVGTLLSDRDPLLLWGVLKEILHEQPDFKTDFKLQLAGNVSDDVLMSIEKHGLMDCTQVLGYLKHQEAVEIMFQSQCLLLIEINSENTKAIIPGKIFEYFASRRPIVAIGPENAAIHDLIEENRAGAYHTYNDRDLLKTNILHYYKLFKDNKNHGNTESHFLKYHRQATTQQLSKIINNLWE